jgi:hypothetical protein
MRLGKLVSILCLATSAVVAQDLAPEVLLLSHIKSYLRYEFAHLPNYTCLETVSRFQRQDKPGAKFQPLDTVRLEIAYSDRHEWFGWPGDRQLSVENPARLAGGAGLMANGIFATTLHNLFLADAVVLTARGEDPVNGRKAIRFDYHFPAGSIISRVSLLGGRGAVNEEGSFWIDPQSLDLIRVDGRVTEIPPSLPLEKMEFTVNYARTRIGEFDALLAQYADLNMIQTTGVEDYDRMDFTHCRMFHAESTLSFDTVAPEPAAAPGKAQDRVAAPPEPERAVPASLRVTIQVTSPINDKDPVGKQIEGRVVGAVRHKGKIVLEDGAVVRGRIRQLQRYLGLDQFIVGLEFTEVQTQGSPLRFYADLVSLEKGQGVQPLLRQQVLVSNKVASTTEITLPELPGIASFFVEGKTFTLPSGLHTFWRTRELSQGIN